VTSGYGQTILHGADYLVHVGSGFQQVGALGKSPHSEKSGSHLIFGPGMKRKND